jgi:IS5 family transposase
MALRGFVRSDAEISSLRANFCHRANWIRRKKRRNISFSEINKNKEHTGVQIYKE